MELKINITTSDSCKVIISDQSEYLPEDFTGTAKGKFKFSETVTINVLKLNKVQENVVKTYQISEHVDLNKSIELPIKFDGWFTVEHIVLPSKQWFETEIVKNTGSALNLYSIVYFADNDTIYKYINGQTYAVPLDEILEINTINTTISKTSNDYISICYLRKCYIDLCQQIFNDRAFSSCWSKNKVDSETTYKRDLTWMAINVIKYLTECNQLYEVERIIEIIQGCNGLCNSTNKSNVQTGCGCTG